jgi:hypothetical protein
MDPRNPDDSNDGPVTLAAASPARSLPRVPLAVAGALLVTAVVLPLAFSARNDPGFAFIAMMLALAGLGAALTVSAPD